MDFTHHYSSPLGGITMASDGECLTGLWFDGQKYSADTLPAQHEEKDLDVFRRTDKWLDLYFSGTDPDFRPPIRMNGTAFRKEVWQILLTIPFGKTMTYGEIAKILADRRGNNSMSAQAVGGAVAHNPVSLIIPCHRVIGTNGALTGYAGGLDKKTWLLDMERKNTLDKKR